MGSTRRAAQVLVRTWRLIGEFRRDWSKARVGGLSAEIAFFAILGLFPAVLVFSAGLGWLDTMIGADTADSIEQWVLERISDVFGTDNTLQQTASDLFSRTNAGLVTVGVLIAGYASSRGFTAVVRALDVVSDTQRRWSWWSARIAGLVITFITLAVASLVAAMVVVGPLLGVGEEVVGEDGVRLFGASEFATAAWVWLRWPLVVLVVVVWAASVYRFVPRRGAPWRSEVPGAILATVWWLAVSLGFRSYVTVASQGVNAVFGILGGALSLLLWLYLLAMGLLAGAVLNGVLSKGQAARSAGDRPTPETEPVR